MTTLTAYADSRLDSFFATVIGFCADFCAGARQGRSPVPPNRPDGPQFLTVTHRLRFLSTLSSVHLDFPVRGPTTNRVCPISAPILAEEPVPTVRDHEFALSFPFTNSPPAAATMPGPSPRQSAFGLSRKTRGASVRACEAREACDRRGAVPRRRSGRRLLSRRAGGAQGQHDRADRRRADSGDRRAGRPSSASCRPSTGCRARHRSRRCAIPN